MKSIFVIVAIVALFSAGYCLALDNYAASFWAAICAFVLSGAKHYDAEPHRQATLK